MTMRYDIFESGGNAGVLLAHGITGAPTEMKPLIKALAAAGFTVSCPQLAGHCSTLAELKRTRWEDWYGSLQSALEVLRQRCETVCVSGLSMGALLALILAARNPNEIAGAFGMGLTHISEATQVDIGGDR